MIEIHVSTLKMIEIAIDLEYTVKLPFISESKCLLASYLNIRLKLINLFTSAAYLWFLVGWF